MLTLVMCLFQRAAIVANKKDLSGLCILRKTVDTTTGLHFQKVYTHTGTSYLQCIYPICSYICISRFGIHSEKKGTKTVPLGYYCHKWYPFFKGAIIMSP